MQLIAMKRDLIELAVPVGVGVVAIVLYGIHFLLSGSLIGTALETCAVALLVACSSWLFGYFLGFLFAIPRALNRDHKSTSDGTALGMDWETTYKVNANLEEVSDWLTKIVVGLGLVNLQHIPEYAVRFGNYFAVGFGSSSSSPRIALAVAVLFLVSGFLTGYLTTRLELTQRLRETERIEAATSLGGPNKKIYTLS
jgi:ABC-type amino acid transport system permease subunit